MNIEHSTSNAEHRMGETLSPHDRVEVRVGTAAAFLDHVLSISERFISFGFGTVDRQTMTLVRNGKRVSIKRKIFAASESLPMVERFQRSRWSEARKRIDAMRPGETIELPESDYFNANTSARRSNDAYAGTRKWTLCRIKGEPIRITRNA